MRTGFDVRDRFDPRHAIESLAALRERAEQLARGGEVELFLRSSLTLRGTSERDGKGPSIQHGYEEGLAVRVWWPAGRAGFAATSSPRAGGIGPVIEGAVATATRAARERPWARGTGGVLEDHDPEAQLPDPADVARWLEASVASITAHGPGVGVSRITVEASRTLETWVATGGLVASRARARAWAHARIRRPGPGGTAESTHAMASRSWAGLDAAAWSWVLPAPAAVADPAARAPAVPVVFAPAAAATLVRALVETLHGPGARPGPAVGPGWRVVDDPLEPGALLGGSFDDAGFPSRRVVLADGARVVATIGTAGSLRRPSFRDPPGSRPAALRVEPTERALPEVALLAGPVRLHALAPDSWVLETEVAELRNGRLQGPAVETTLAVRPGDLARACAGTVGEAWPTHLGVVTPGIVFDPWPRAPRG